MGVYPYATRPRTFPHEASRAFPQIPKPQYLHLAIEGFRMGNVVIEESTFNGLPFWPMKLKKERIGNSNPVDAALFHLGGIGAAAKKLCVSENTLRKHFALKSFAMAPHWLVDRIVTLTGLERERLTPITSEVVKARETQRNKGKKEPEED